MQGAFQRARIAALCPLIWRTAAAAFDALAGHAARGEPVDLAAEVAPLMLGIIGQALFSVDLRADAGPIGEDFAAVLAAIPPRPPPDDPAAIERAMARLDEVAHGLIAHRRRDPGAHDDLLASLLAARDPDTGAGMTDQELRDEIMTLLLGGYENSAHALAWAIHLLAGHPGAQAAARDEVDRALGDGPADHAHVERLPYLGRVMAEAMRLFPPVWAFGRKACQDDEIGGVAIPAGASVTVCPYAMHRHPAFWADPESFDPDRFLPGPAAARPRLAYLPFGAGERVCVGLPLAEPESLLVLAALLQRHELRPVPGHVVEPDTLVTLRPAHGVRVTLRARR